jgi:hypothetical protein
MNPVKNGESPQKLAICWACRRPGSGGCATWSQIRGVGMADVIFVVLTIAIFAIFGLVVKAVERL